MAPRSNSKLASADAAISPLGVVAPPPIHVQTAAFEGSLAMLFTCVRDHKVDLLDIPLAPICEAYFAYILGAPETRLDEAAAALVALAYLLERKAWLLLPTPEPEPEALDAMEPIEPTVHEFGAAIEALRRWHAERASLFFRAPEVGPNPYELPYELEQVSAADLARAFERLLSRAEPELARPPSRDVRSLAEVIDAVLLAVSDTWKSLDALLPERYTRTDAVYWFLAVLELIRLGQVSVRVGAGSGVEFARRAQAEQLSLA
ncbi:MAG: segregation and condensation protein A [Fimbriimonadaceae bacterium]